MHPVNLPVLMHVRPVRTVRHYTVGRLLGRPVPRIDSGRRKAGKHMLCRGWLGTPLRAAVHARTAPLISRASKQRQGRWWTAEGHRGQANRAGRLWGSTCCALHCTQQPQQTHHNASATTQQLPTPGRRRCRRPGSERSTGCSRVERGRCSSGCRLAVGSLLCVPAGTCEEHCWTSKGRSPCCLCGAIALAGTARLMGRRKLESVRGAHPTWPVCRKGLQGWADQWVL